MRLNLSWPEKNCSEYCLQVDFSVDLEISREILSMASKNKYTSKQRLYKLFSVVYHNGREATKVSNLIVQSDSGHYQPLAFTESVIRENR